MISATKSISRLKTASVVALCVLIGIITLFDFIVPYRSSKNIEQAWIGVALAAVSAAISIAGAISENNKKKKLAAQMEKMKLEKPQGLINAENTLSALASQGLPGKDLMEDALKEPLAQSLTNMRELGASPVTVAGMASTGMSQVTDNIRQLLVSDAQAKMGNMVNLANFQAGPAAQFDLQQQEFNINKTLGAEYARMEGTAALYQGISNAVGTAGSAVSNQQYLNYLKSLNQPGNNNLIAGWNGAMTEDQFKAAKFQYELAKAMQPSLDMSTNPGVGVNGMSDFQLNGMANQKVGQPGFGQQPWSNSLYSTPTYFTKSGGLG